MDPFNNSQENFRRNQLNSRNADLRENKADVPGNDEEQPVNAEEYRGRPERATPERGAQPQHSVGFTIIPPNQSRRSKLTAMAQKEEQDLQRYREANKPAPLNLDPEQLGGNITLAEARQKQQNDARCFKLQKKLKKEELDRKTREEEEAKNQQKKAEQREKAERQEKKKQQEEQRRRQLHREDHLRVTDSFLQRFEKSPWASSSATHTSSRSKAEKSSQRPKSEREVQLDHRRVNSAFLDRLEGQGRGIEEGESKQEEAGAMNEEDAMEEKGTLEEGFTDFPFEESETTHQQGPVNPLEHCWIQDTGPDPEYDWALKKLASSFPEISKAFLEDILNQCKGDYEEASILLISTLS